MIKGLKLGIVASLMKYYLLIKYLFGRWCPVKVKLTKELAKYCFKL